MIVDMMVDSKSARIKACNKQCRIQKFINGKTVFDGNCICEKPNQCWFGLDNELDIDPTRMFPDIADFYRQLVTE